MIDNTILEALESFCLKYVAPKINLQAPNDDNVKDYHLMHPNVFIGWIPPPNQLEDVPLQLPDGVKRAIPAVVIGMDDGDDDGSDAGLNIRLTFITYSPGHYPEEGRVIPNFKGYTDLLNFMFIARQQLSTHYLVEGGKTAAQKPFRWGMYQQQPIPYWVGYLTFRATAAILPYIPEPDLIQD
jgi:hypothetical protein